MAAAPAALLASRPFDKGDGRDATIDLTPLFLPPIIFIFGAVALFVLALSGNTNQEHGAADAREDPALMDE